MNFRLLIFSLLVAVLTACQKDLDLEYHDIDPLPVVEAQLTSGGVSVVLTLTTPMDEPMDRTRLTDATVVLTDLTSGESVLLAPDADGVYTAETGGITGHEYELSVGRGGQTFTALTEMYPPAEILGMQFSWIQMPYDEVAVLQGVFADDPTSEGDCYWVKLYRNGEIYMWNQVDDRGASAGAGTFFTMTSRRDTDAEDEGNVLRDGDVMTLTISRVSRAMYNYLEGLQNDSNGPAMFSGPSRCLGYFVASTPASASITFRPDEIPQIRP